jgi:hypothetical protein
MDSCSFELGDNYQRQNTASGLGEMYPTTLSKEEIPRATEAMILKHGDDAFAEATKEISASNSRGDFCLAGLWVLVCQRINNIHALNDHGGNTKKDSASQTNAWKHTGASG